MIDRLALANFLRRRRAQLNPPDVGLPPGGRRRTPGLRRDEVALLAGMSNDYYTRLEQARGANPSETIVASLARALRCDDDARDHLFRLAGFVAPARPNRRRIRPGVMSLVEHLGDVPVCIATDLHEVLWLNDLAETVLGMDLDRHAGLARNYTWRCFTDPGVRGRFAGDDWPRYAAVQVNDLRAACARNAGGGDTAYADQLVTDLRSRSREFRELWDRHEVAVRLSEDKRMVHPRVGHLALTCEIITPEPGLKVIAYFPTAGTDARDKLDALRVGAGHRVTA
ncbi:helix-turn-helix transcriptional regulator [Myceligenerans salitolerans]|uniref:Helix-turn-helix domain-containing protein n=1 Tax=Myceligenerans salitolerans TaxID=1230528 RepID=A0ABS3ICH7_9MICO|nr:helix-turn-helix transcriptional regulator [Myceligenerans salitolerans]MBO0610094.1 helix-turn-helix domain-containing protein [Myceligenerans salitolerans]